MTKFQTILLAVLSAVIAGLIFKFVPDLKEVGTGFAGLTLLLLGWAKQHPQDKPGQVDVVKTTGPGGAAVVLALGSLLLAGQAQAQGGVVDMHVTTRPCPQLAICFPSVNLRLAPGGAIGWQLNLKTGDAAQGVALGGGSLTWDNGAFPSLGIGLYGGTSIDPDGARYQGSVVIDVMDWVGIGLGLQGFQEREESTTCPDGTIVPGEKRFVTQGVFSVLVKASVGSTSSGFLRAVQGVQ